ncbi:hypothetical protein ANN_28064 [Periplaneta americana]|uniref:Uncharacterized protein n=1 Tax=Periplaneta americana TaxID=6978 RepID=A0ABQ8RUV3_PERAM|nr:hypothetical protein ANN_28064 [Periplaneta americana]
MAVAQTDGDLKKLEVDSEVHHRKAQKAYKPLASDTQFSKENANMIVLCVDLQQKKKKKKKKKKKRGEITDMNTLYRKIHPSELGEAFLSTLLRRLISSRCFPVRLEQWYEEKEDEKVLRKIFGSLRDEVIGEEEMKT